MLSDEQERKRQRLEAWRNKKSSSTASAPPPKVRLQLKPSAVASAAALQQLQKPTKKKKKRPKNPFQSALEEKGEAAAAAATKMSSSKSTTESPNNNSAKKRSNLEMEDSTATMMPIIKETPTKKKKKRWDNNANSNDNIINNDEEDALEKFMDQLQAGAVSEIQLQAHQASSKVDVSGSVMRKPHTSYQPSDWMSDAAPTPDQEQEDQEDEDDEQEQAKRRALIEALVAKQSTDEMVQQASASFVETKTELQSEKQRKQLRLQELQLAAERAAKAQQTSVNIGRLDDSIEDGILEEAERDYLAASAAPDALQVLAELNKKKELTAVDHSTVEYAPIVKNVYRVPRQLASLKHDDVLNRRAKLHVRVRGHGAPCPVDTFEETGLPEILLQALHQRDHITTPFPIQAQCLPCILAGRDVIGIAKTGSGKTLAYVLPLLRHITVQPELAVERGDPMALILAPARELAFQIHSVCKRYAKLLGLK